MAGEAYPALRGERRRHGNQPFALGASPRQVPVKALAQDFEVMDFSHRPLPAPEGVDPAVDAGRKLLAQQLRQVTQMLGRLPGAMNFPRIRPAGLHERRGVDPCRPQHAPHEGLHPPVRTGGADAGDQMLDAPPQLAAAEGRGGFAGGAAAAPAHVTPKPGQPSMFAHPSLDRAHLHIRIPDLGGRPEKPAQGALELAGALAAHRLGDRDLRQQPPCRRPQRMDALRRRPPPARVTQPVARLPALRQGAREPVAPRDLAVRLGRHRKS